MINTLKEMTGYERALLSKPFVANLALVMAIYLPCAAFATWMTMSSFDVHALMINTIALYIGFDLSYAFGSLRKHQCVVLPDHRVRMLRFGCDSVFVFTGAILNYSIRGLFYPSWYQLLFSIILNALWYGWGYYQQGMWERKQEKRDSNY